MGLWKPYPYLSHIRVKSLFFNNILFSLKTHSLCAYLEPLHSSPAPLSSQKKCKHQLFSRFYLCGDGPLPAVRTDCSLVCGARTCLWFPFIQLGISLNLFFVHLWFSGSQNFSLLSFSLLWESSFLMGLCI